MDIEGAELDGLERVPAGALPGKAAAIEFHEFVYPDSHVRIEAVKNDL